MRGNRRMTQQKSNNEFEVKWKKKALLWRHRRRKIAPHENDESKKKRILTESFHGTRLLFLLRIISDGFI